MESIYINDRQGKGEGVLDRYLSPRELENQPLLRIFGSSKYIVIVYDAKGNPLWAVNRESHKERFLLERFLTAPVFAFYDLPVQESLTALWKHLKGRAGAAPLNLEPLEKISIHHANLNFPGFRSKNVAEQKALVPNYVFDRHLTALRLIKINDERFLGIVHFTTIIADLIAYENTIMALTDDNNVICGLNSLFADMLGLKAPESLLGRKMTDVLRFDRVPFDMPAVPAAENFRTALSWRAGKPAGTLRFVESEYAKFTPGKEGIFWDNRKSALYSYIRLAGSLAVDNAHFTLDIEFAMPVQRLPNVIFRGFALEKEVFPDYMGFTFAGDHENAFSFKQRSNIQYHVTTPQITPNAFHRLTVRKTFDWFSFYLDGKPIGRWKNMVPFLMESDDLCFLFLRPGESMTLRALKLKTCPYDKHAMAGALAPILARPADPAVQRRFLVNFHQGSSQELNYAMYLFEDVTNFQKNIDYLKRERDKLETLLRHEQDFVGRTPGILAVKNELPAIAGSDLSVLIEGETGTGKEVLAGMIHRLSPRAGSPFVKIDCSAIPRELLESELFGHEKGAFTGAVAGHAGRFEQAQGGTVFLDEVANLPVEIQMKLLNVLQDRSVQRVGGTRPMALDIRIIAASNVPLKTLTGQGRFRLDLYYRLNQCRVEIPPLRDRKDDIPLLAGYFLKAAAKNYGKDVRGFDRSAMALLYGHEWPGNVRELSNTVNRAVIFARGGRIGKKDIALEKAVRKAPSAAGRRGGPRQKWSVGKARLSAVLKANHGNISKVMAALGVSRPMVYKFIHRYKIRINLYRKAKK